jgi:CheY-like chemotaxis protein
MDKRKDGTGLKALLAEDNHFNQQIATLTLQSAGYEVDIASTGRQVIEMWMDGKYDLILMDLEMPDIDGLEATAAIRRMEKTRGGHIPIFAVSAHNKLSHLERCLTAGMDDYIAKPIGVGDLAIKIKNFGSKAPDTGSTGVSKNLPFDLSSLRGMFSENEVRELVTLFLKRGTDLIGEINTAITEKDAKSLRLKAHQLKGSSSQLRAVSLTHIASKMEKLAETGELAGAGALFTEMKAVFEETAKALEKDIQG